MAWPGSSNSINSAQSSSIIDRSSAGSRSHFSNLPTGPLVFLDGVAMDFAGHRALESIQLSLQPGELLFITGPSGAGKSTLLKILSGDLRPTQGRVVVASKGRANFGQVFQDLKLIEGETLRENLEWSYDSELWKSHKEFVTQLKDLAHFFEFENQLNKSLDKVNGGLKQKVALVRALLSSPDILVLDEPTAHLDFRSSQRVFEAIQFYNSKKGMTVVWASHDRELVRKFNGRIVHIEKGRLVYSGNACFI